MRKSNVDIFRKAMKGVNEKITTKLMQTYYPIAKMIAEEAHNSPIYKSATGNAITSYMAYAITPKGIVQGYDSLKGSRPPIASKVPKGEKATFFPAYDGRPNASVYGRVDLETSSSAEAIQRVLKGEVSYKNYLLAIRIGHPVEYEEYLTNKKQKQQPIVTMHNTAMAVLK